PRSISQTKSSGRKSKSSSTIKRKHGKANVYNGEPKWYLETLSSINTNNNNNNDNTAISSTISTPIIDRSSRRLGSSSSSLCSTPNDRSLGRAIFDINTMLMSIGLGRHLPAQIDASSIRTFQQQQPPVIYSTNETVKTKDHKKINSTPIINDTIKQTNE
ncbi:unnamed protein product, partial [Rotaria sordida]